MGSDAAITCNGSTKPSGVGATTPAASDTTRNGASKRHRPSAGPATGARVVCKASFDNSDHVGQVVDVRPLNSGDTEVFVHYENCDKRLDEWVPANDLRPCTDDLAAELAIRPSETDLAGDTFLAGRPRRKRRVEISANGVKHDAQDGKHGDDEDGKAHPLKARYIEYIEFGGHELKTWYYSPFPEPFNKLQRLYVCDFTMKYFRKRMTALRHSAAIPHEDRHPPGDQIYLSPLPGSEWQLSSKERPLITAATNPQIAVWEVDGEKAKLYCQNLCLMSKLFLDGKTLFWEVHEFMFYVLCERLADGDHMVGYFSREKSNETNHLACFLTMPHKQRFGYGGFIIDLSYELAKKGNRTGTPERPFSDLGRSAFVEYWERTLFGKLQHLGKGYLTAFELGEMTGIHSDDVIATLGSGSRFCDMKIVQYNRGEYVLHASDSASIQTLYALLIDNKQRLVVDPVSLHYTCSTPRQPRQ